MPLTHTDLRAGLADSTNSVLVDELLEAYQEAKTNYFAGGLRLSEVEGGRFCEAAFRILEERAFESFTPLGVHLDSEALLRRLKALPYGRQPESIRIHIPRCLRVIYDIRNKRDAAHLGDGIDPNLQDATLVVSLLDWVLAELVRLFHSVAPNKAQAIVGMLVTRRAPVVEDFDGFPKVLRPDLSASAMCLVLLHQSGATGASLDELRRWVPPRMRSNLRRTLGRLVTERAEVHFDGSTYWITQLGEKEVERCGFLKPLHA